MGVLRLCYLFGHDCGLLIVAAYLVLPGGLLWACIFYVVSFDCYE